MWLAALRKEESPEVSVVEKDRQVFVAASTESEGC